VQLTPRYGSDPVVSVQVREPGDHPVRQQRIRLGRVLAELSDDEWGRQSRCEEWTVQDVVSHLISTNRFWKASIEAGLAGTPTTFLATFDPVTSPLETTRRARGTPPAQTLAEYLATTAELVEVVDALEGDRWDAPAEAPTGHVPIRLVADHSLWDAWVHERDILLPLGRHPVVDDVEVLTALRYTAALGPAFAACAGAAPPPPIELRATGPDARFVVETVGSQVRVHDGDPPAGAARVELDAVTLLEHLSRRDPGGDPPDALLALIAPVATVFDQPV
jgi:uncharacterized protein (TIGR03083 family)